MVSVSQRGRRFVSRDTIHGPGLCLNWRIPMRPAVSLVQYEARKGDEITACMSDEWGERAFLNAIYSKAGSLVTN